MSDPAYKTCWAVNQELEGVEAYVNRTLAGISPDRIVSVSHAMAMGLGPWYSLSIVARTND
jgi:hypothetical protein